MSFMAKVLPWVLGGVVGGLASGGGQKPAPAPAQPTRDDAAAAIAAQDALTRRKGAAADIITGTTGAEAAKGAVGRLVVGS